jgi:hypothetical protein
MPESVSDRCAGIPAGGDRREQPGWLPSAEEWNELRQVRNQLAHAHPEAADARHCHLFGVSSRAVFEQLH